MADKNQKTGAYGELLARQYLERKGYRIITTNWHCPYGEADIIAEDGEVLVFVEVRTRHSGTTETAFASITTKKRERLIQTAYSYLSETERDDALWRIDMVAIALPYNEAPLIQHREDVLDW